VKLYIIFFSWIVCAGVATFANTAIDLDVSPGLLDAYSRSSQWTKLLHLKKGRVAKRLHEDAPFYITEGGFRNSLVELQATIEAFSYPENYLKKGRGHPQCLFPARFRVLKRDLHLKIDQVSCPALEQWKSEVKSKKIVIAFASQFISHPGSIMGHTFLKFQNLAQKDYLNRTIGYAAEIPEGEPTTSYIFRGLFGGFRGQFSEQPYYEKVQEYNNMESRDIWEYSLKLSEDEKNLFIEHLWELKENGVFDYYYLDENCSYILLAALEAVKPYDEIVSKLPPYVLPLETIKTLSREGLIDNTVWRPSLRTQMMSKFETLSETDKKKTVQAIRTQSLSEIDNPVALEVVLDDVERTKVKFKGELPENLVNFQKQTLLKRAQLGIVSPIKMDEPPSLLKGHSPFHIESTLGRRKEGDFFGFRFRPFLHNFLDNDIGYLKNSSISFMEIDGRWWFKDSKSELHEIILFDVELTRPYSGLEPNSSWKLRAGYRDKTYYFDPAFGVAWEISKRLDFLLMAQGNYENNNDFEKNYRLWPGLLIQAIWNFDNEMKWVHTESLARELAEGNNLTLLKTDSEFRKYNVLSHVDVGIEFIHSNYFSDQDSETEALIKIIYDF
jgi:hypothetical protein